MARRTASRLECKVNYIRPVTDGELRCRAWVVHGGRRTQVLEAEVHQGDKLDRCPGDLRLPLAVPPAARGVGTPGLWSKQRCPCEAAFPSPYWGDCRVKESTS